MSLMMMMMMMNDFVFRILCCCLLFGVGEKESAIICVLPSKWVWEPKKVYDERFRAVCVFLTLASQKRVYVSGRKLVFKKKTQIFVPITHYCVYKLHTSVRIWFSGATQFTTCMPY